MKSSFSYTLLNHPLFWVIQCVLAIGFVVVPHGIGLTHDSAMYVFAARKLVETGTLLDPAGNPMVLYPPLYPVLLSIGVRIGISIQLWAIILNILAHSAIVLLVKEEAKQFKNKALTYSLLLLSVYGMPLLQNAVFVWADSVFIALLLAIVVLTRKFVQTNNHIFILMSAVLSVAAIYDRFIGVAMVAAASLQLLLFSHKRIGSRLLYSIGYGLICVIGFVLWEYRNYLQTGVTNHSYEPGIFSWYSNVYEVFSILGSYWLPGNTSSSVRFILTVLFFLVTSGTLYVNRKSLFTIDRSGYHQDFFWVTTLISYLIFFVGLNTVFFICEWDDRYLSPCYPFACLLFFKWLDDYLPIWLKAAWISVIAIVMMGYPMVRYFKNAYQWRDGGIGFNNLNWKANSLLQWVKAHRGGIYISNNSMPVIVPGNKECYFMPIQFSTPVTLIWWKEENKLNYVEWDVTILDQYYEREAGPVFKEGRVYFLTPKK